MSDVPDVAYLYLYIQRYCLACQKEDIPRKEMHEYFYAPDDNEARKLAQELLAMKNEWAILPYVETGLERSAQDAHVCYYLLPAIKERQPNGTYYAKSSPVTQNEAGPHVRRESMKEKENRV